MTQEINLSSLAAVPDDYNAPDGQLDLSLNLINEDNALRPVMQPLPVEDTKGILGNTVFIHQTTSFRHFITLTSTGQIGWIDAKEPTICNPIDISPSANISRISSIGNVLIILSANSPLTYLLFKNDSSKPEYKNLGNGPEMPEISFSLRSSLVKSDEFGVTSDLTKLSGGKFAEDDVANITDQILAKVNKFIAEESTGKGRFMFPFLVRCALRLYDGALIGHTAPVLMCTSSGRTPDVYVTGVYNIINSMFVYALTHSLEIKIGIESLRLLQFKDIVRSIDIFITPPIYTYDQNGKCERRIVFPSGGSLEGTEPYEYFRGCWSQSFNQEAQKYVTINMRDISNQVGNMLTYNHNESHIPVPQFSPEEIGNKIRNAANFYLLKSIPLEDLKKYVADRKEIDIPEDYLQSLLQRELMTDDYESNHKLIPTSAYTYNSRLNLSGIKKKLFRGFSPESVFPYISNINQSKAKISVFIRRENTDLVVESQASSWQFPAIGTPSGIFYFFYPDPNAYKAIIHLYPDDDNANLPIELPLSPHPTLNGALFFNGFETQSSRSAAVPPQPSPDPTINLPNKIYTSEVNNPFFFPLSGITTVGSGTIYAIAAAARPLSQGQFGAFPLYAFSSDGVWALEISATGTFNSRQPITRDICTNPDAITSLDSSVVFPTRRGLMHLSGSVATCISDPIQTDTPFDIRKQLRHSAMFLNNDEILSPVPFTKFLESARILYDYRNQQIVIFSTSIPYAYVFSLRSKAWGMMHSSFTLPINSYPDALAISKNPTTGQKTLVDFGNRKAGHTGVSLLTRPLKLGMPDILKTISSVILRGNFPIKNFTMALYASRDLMNWIPVWSSKTAHLHRTGGTPYKYFRLMATGTIASGQSISSISIEFTQRYTNRLR